LKKINYKKIFFLTLVLLFSVTKISYAANISLEANTSQVKVGDIVTATIYVNASGEAINNVEGLLSVPSDLLQVQSVSTVGSVLNLWVEQPTYASQSVAFNGGITNPGYSGSRGNVVTVFMKALKSGSATISFQSASVRANDGLGTDVLKNKSGTNITITSGVVDPVTTPVETSSPSSLKAPVVYSSLSPNSDTWYKNNKTTFTWDIPNNTTALKTLLGSHADSEPIVLYDSIIRSKTVEDIGDGVWYFHLQYQTPDGWSRIAHKKIKIDTAPPYQTELSYKTLDSGLVELTLSGDDKTSYVSKFVLKTEGKNDIEIKDVDKNGKATFVFPADYSGRREIRVETFDEAGNMSDSSISIDFPTISIPEITSYPQTSTKGEIFTVKGTSSYPDSQIKLYVQIGAEDVRTYDAVTKDDGSFSFDIDTGDKIGELFVWVSVFVDSSSQEISSKKVQIAISGFSYIDFAKKITSILSVFVPAIALLILIIAFGYMVFTRVILADKDRDRNKKINKIEKEALALMDSLKENILEDIHLFKADKNIKDTSEAEVVLLKNLLQDFKNIEKVISTKLKRNKVGKKDETEIGE